jgi:hypothetical protein
MSFSSVIVDQFQGKTIDFRFKNMFRRDGSRLHGQRASGVSFADLWMGMKPHI